MRKFAALVVFFLAVGGFAMAQVQAQLFELPKNELALGYAYQHADISGSEAAVNDSFLGNSTGMNGFAIGFSHYLRYMHGNLGYTIEVARVSNSRVDSSGDGYARTSYLAGPTYHLHRYGFFSPGVHFLAGIDRGVFTIREPGPTTFTFTNTEFGAIAGGTVDGNLSPHIGIRLAQVDYVYTHHYGGNQYSFRYSGGVVFRF